MSLTPAARAEESGKVDIMNIYVKERQAHREQMEQNKKKYEDRWYEHVSERYGVTLKGMKAEPAAKSLFERYKELEASFDPALADLYKDDAKIDATWIEESGEKKSAILTGAAYKDVIRKSMTEAQEKKDTSTYTEIVYTVLDTGVQVSGKKKSSLKDTADLFSLLLVKDAEGKWMIGAEKIEPSVGEGEAPEKSSESESLEGSSAAPSLTAPVATTP